ncbi:hypothetical protein [Legionella parisiensis]|uniref:Uncharacterized protein n=1 Tax=Legionella parisiensis TaxID=45071 RepID=A0A1E5JQY1_9GAMM|nr:hypothetical protein [Legionella parisiensis]KTD41513.1 hypothetical protein Lpar_2830 [Legionella parisiensis]OEH46915.1 hypothetical protein lpari_02117 [Legionella parisiensis]STX76169.1 Uncharacterised protein [Legionella parisiensis]
MAKYFFALGPSKSSGDKEAEEEEEYPLENEDEYYISSNNQHESLDPLLAAEYAVFSGNLLRHILGSEHPEYHLLRNKNSTKYYRAAKLLENYNDWQEVVTVLSNGSINFQHKAEDEPKNILDVNIVGLIDLFVACHFLGETDWEGGNFGFIKINDAFFAIRLDPGCSFNSFIIENNINLEKYIDNFIINYLTKEITGNSEDDKYLTEILDHENKKFKSFVAQKLFSDRERIISTMRKVAELSENDLHAIKMKSFSISHFPIADKLIAKLLSRRDLYIRFINHLEKDVHQEETEKEEYDESNSVGQKRKRKKTIGFFNQSSLESPHQSQLGCDNNSQDNDKNVKDKRARIDSSTRSPSQH